MDSVQESDELFRHGFLFGRGRCRNLRLLHGGSLCGKGFSFFSSLCPDGFFLGFPIGFGFGHGLCFAFGFGFRLGLRLPLRLWLWLQPLL